YYSVTELNNGNILIRSPNWNGRRGALTWENGNSWINGTVSDANSLIGSNPDDELNVYITSLNNGNFVVNTRNWNGNRGASTWVNGSTGIHGTISAANSLVGNNPFDFLGDLITPLSNGNYVVGFPSWNGNRGAATWVNGSTGVSGTVSETNSLV